MNQKSESINTGDDCITKEGDCINILRINAVTHLIRAGRLGRCGRSETRRINLSEHGVWRVEMTECRMRL